MTETADGRLQFQPSLYDQSIGAKRKPHENAQEYCIVPIERTTKPNIIIHIMDDVRKQMHDGVGKP